MDIFKKQLLENFIPRVQVMLENEKEHTAWLYKNNAPKEYIEKSKHLQIHYETRIDEYLRFALQGEWLFQ